MTVAEIMPARVISVGMDDTLATIQELFARHRFHHLMVAGPTGHLQGVISDRDLLKHLSPFAGGAGEQRRDLATLKMHAHQIMTRRPVTARPATDVRDAGRLLIEKRISCLPVVDDDGKLVGVVTWKDLLRALVQVAADGSPV